MSGRSQIPTQKGPTHAAALRLWNCPGERSECLTEKVALLSSPLKAHLWLKTQGSEGPLAGGGAGPGASPVPALPRIS